MNRNLYVLLWKLGMTQARFADEIQVARNTVWRWINQPEIYKPSTLNRERIIALARSHKILVTHDDLLKIEKKENE
jgi:DNA-binding XRE family transcriptional regulator